MRERDRDRTEVTEDGEKQELKEEARHRRSVCVRDTCLNSMPVLLRCAARGVTDGVTMTTMRMV